MKDNFGLTHLAITLGIMIPVASLVSDSNVVGFVGGVVAGYWFWREWKGAGNLWGYPEGWQGEHNNDWDRRLDWGLPLLGVLGTLLAHMHYGAFIEYLGVLR